MTSLAALVTESGVRGARVFGRRMPFVLVALLLVAGLEGCSSGPSTPLSPPTAPLPAVSVSVVSPTDGAMVKSLPVTLQLKVSGATSLKGSAVTVNGTDITSSLTVAADGTAMTALGASYVYIGTNRVDVTTGTAVSSAKFTYDPTTADFVSPQLPRSTAVGGSGAFSDVVAIQTRIVQSAKPGAPGVAQHWGIKVGSQMYWQPTSALNGFQVLILRRSDLSVVSNLDYEIDLAAAAEAFAQAILPQPSFTKASNCGQAGCLMVIQSLGGVGAISCTLSGDCPTFAQVFTAIGGTNILPGSLQLNTAGVGYSFVGNVGANTLHAGSNYERVTCATPEGCLQTGAPDDQHTLEGIVPNGRDGATPTLLMTSDGTYSLLDASTQTYAANNGAMSGVLVLDNHDQYTFGYSAPPVHFAMGLNPSDTGRALVQLTTPTKASFRFPDGSTTVTYGSAALPPNVDGSQAGGFLLTAFDSTTFRNVANATFVVRSDACPPLNPPTQNYCIGPDGTQLYSMDQMATQITQLRQLGVIFFVQAIGNLHHRSTFAGYPSSNGYNNSFDEQDAWNKAAQGIQDIGGTFATFVSLNNQAFTLDRYDQYSKLTEPQDDYVMVGQWWFNDSGVSNPYAAEESSQISRQTVKQWGGSRMTGILQKEQDGYYRVTSESAYGDFFPKSSLTFLSTATRPPTPWPLTDANATPGLQNAYQWTSQQLMGCVDGCNSIRAAYPNLNQDPVVWLAILEGLDAPSSCAGACDQGFSLSDFETAKTQLVEELRYLAAVRSFRGNMTNLLQAEQVNQGVILQQELDSILSNTTFNQNSSSYGVSNWRTWASDALHVAGPAVGLGAAAAAGVGIIATGGVAAPIVVASAGVIFALGASAINLSAKTTNNTNGASLAEQEHEQLAASLLAGQTADQYSEILTSVGHDFDRIVSDWGRLSTLGGTLTDNSLVWDGEATGVTLKSFDLTARRQFVRTILKAGYQVNHYRYASPGINLGSNNAFLPNSTNCNYYDFLGYQAEGNQSDPTTQQTYASFAYLPGAPIDGPGMSLQNTANTFPFDLWWDVWTMTEQRRGFQGCTDTNQMPANSLFLNTGIFTPMDPTDANALGIYKTWFYQRDFAGSILEVETPSDAARFWNGQNDGSTNFHFGSDGAALDPDSY